MWIHGDLFPVLGSAYFARLSVTAACWKHLRVQHRRLPPPPADVHKHTRLLLRPYPSPIGLHKYTEWVSGWIRFLNVGVFCRKPFHRVRRRKQRTKDAVCVLHKMWVRSVRMLFSWDRKPSWTNLDDCSSIIWWPKEMEMISKIKQDV